MDQVRETLNAINRAWRQQDFSAMEALFDKDVVMKGPGMKEFGRGREAVIQSYVQFMAQSRVVEYEESNQAIDVWGDVAAATYDWAMTYEQKGRTSSDKGHDMFVFRRQSTGWVAVLRLILF